MKNHFSCLIILLCSYPSIAQMDSVRRLTMHKTFGGAHFEYQKDTTIFLVSPKQVLSILKDDQNTLAYEEFKKARNNSTAAGILGFAGGVLIGFPIGTAIAGGEPEWGMAAGGAALIIASIPLASAYKRHAENAVNQYNSRHTAFKPKVDYYFLGTGLKVIIRF